jgi:hypothetical protein
MANRHGLIAGGHQREGVAEALTKNAMRAIGSQLGR